MAKQPTPARATPAGAGAAYETEASGSGNENGKASATAAGGDQANSPVIGNPGEARPDMAYDYGLAAAAPASTPSNPRAASAPLESAAVKKLPADPLLTKNGKVRPGSSADDTEYAELVRARAKGEYGGIKEKGEVFNNDRNLPTYPEDPASWFEDADRDVNWEDQDKPARRKAR